MDVDSKDASEISDDSSSGPEEITNKDAKEMAVTTIKAEIASQRSLKEKTRKLKIQVELRNIEQKKIKEEKKETVDEDDSSSPKIITIEIDEEAAPPKVEEIAEKPEKIIEFKKNKKTKQRKNPGNSNDKSDSSTVKNQVESKSDPIVKSKPKKGKPKKLSGKARKGARNRFIRACLGNASNNNSVGSSGAKTQKDTRRFKKQRYQKAKNPKNNVAGENKSTGKANGNKRKFEETKNDTPKIKSMKTGINKSEPAIKVKSEPTIKVKSEPN